MKLWGGGDLIHSTNQHRFQVAEHLDQHPCEIHLNGQRKRRARAAGGEKAKLHFCNIRVGVEPCVFYSDDGALDEARIVMEDEDQVLLGSCSSCVLQSLLLLKQEITKSSIQTLLSSCGLF